MNSPEVLATQAAQTGRKMPVPRRKAFFLLVVVGFLNMMGVTIIAPVVPFMTSRYLSDPKNLAVVVAWMLTIYGLCQLVAAPALGLLSDRFGRRPVLLICLLGSALGYVLFGLGGALWVLFSGRVIDGLTGGNFSVIFAYIADITEPEERGKYFGIMGGFSGVGFIIGPSIGGLLANISYGTPFLVAAAIVMLSIVWGLFFLPESLSKEQRVTSVRLRDLNPLRQIGNVFTLANLRWLLLASFLYFIPFAIMQANLTVFLKDSLGWGAAAAGLVATVVGVVDILVQGVLMGKLLPIFGDIRLSISSLILVALSYVLLGAVALIASPVLLLAAIILFSGASGLVENALRSLTSRLAGARQQGVVGGADQALQSLALILGPLLGGWLYVQFGHATPYWSGALIILLALGSVILAVLAMRGRSALDEAETKG